MNTFLYVFKLTRFYVFWLRSIAEDTFPRQLRAAMDTLINVIWYDYEATMDTVLAASLVLVQNSLTVIHLVRGLT